MHGLKFDISKKFWEGTHRAPFPDPSTFYLTLCFRFGLRARDQGFVPPKSIVLCLCSFKNCVIFSDPAWLYATVAPLYFQPTLFCTKMVKSCAYKLFLQWISDMYHYTMISTYTSEVVFSKSEKNALEKKFRAHARYSLIDFDAVPTFFHRQLATLAVTVDAAAIIFLTHIMSQYFDECCLRLAPRQCFPINDHVTPSGQCRPR